MHLTVREAQAVEQIMEFFKCATFVLDFFILNFLIEVLDLFVKLLNSGFLVLQIFVQCLYHLGSSKPGFNFCNHLCDVQGAEFANLTIENQTRSVAVNLLENRPQQGELFLFCK